MELWLLALPRSTSDRLTSQQGECANLGPNGSPTLARGKGSESEQSEMPKIHAVVSYLEVFSLSCGLKGKPKRTLPKPFGNCPPKTRADPGVSRRSLTSLEGAKSQRPGGMARRSDSPVTHPRVERLPRAQRRARVFCRRC